MFVLRWISRDHVSISLTPNVGHKHLIRHRTHSKELIFTDKGRRRTALRQSEGQTLGLGMWAGGFVCGVNSRKKVSRKIPLISVTCLVGLASL